MKIKSISIQNYKCHKSIKDMPFHDLTTIIGENDSGKTAIIDFLEIMLTNSIPKVDDYYRSIEINSADDTPQEVAQERIIGEIKFSLDTNEKEALASYLDDKKDLILKKVFTTENNNTYYYSKKYSDDRFYEYESMNAGKLKDFLEDLGLRKENNQDLRKIAIKKYMEETEIPYSFEWIEIQFMTIKGFLPKFIRYNVDDYKNPNNMIFKVLQEVFKNEIYTKREDGTYHLKDEGLKTILEEVRLKIVESAQQFKKHIQKYNDKILDITIEPEIDLSSGLKQSPIRVKDETGLFHYIDNRGFGTKKRIFMAIFEWNKEVVAGIDHEYAIRCYDEPDNNLHIEAQRKLYKTIKSIVDETNQKNQVLICTHSLFMIDSSPANSINLIKRNGSGSTIVEYLKSFGDEEIQNFIELMCREMGLSNSHIFFERCFIIVEGQSEVNFLPSAYKKMYHSTMAEDGITLINLEGNGAATNFLKLLMKNKREFVIVFLDNDTTDVRKSKVMSGHNKLVDGMKKEEYKQFVYDFFEEKVLFIGDKEFEDTFENEVFVKVLNNKRPKNNELLWNEEEIENIRINVEKFSNGITKAVADFCKPNYISKPELGTYLGQGIEIDEIPEKAKELFRRAREIANIE